MKTVATTTLLAILCALGGLTAGCASAVKGPEGDVPFDGKADSFAQPTEHGIVAFGDEQIAEFDFDERFHAFDFDLSQAADVAIDTSDPLETGVDTVVYLYGETEAGWGSYLQKNDDVGASLLSHIDASLEAGHYRVLVKGYDLYEDGPFGLTVSCAGAGCTAEDVDLAAAFAEAAAGANYTSEADYEPVFVRTTPADPAAELTPSAVRQAFSAEILALMEAADWNGLTIEGDSDDLLDNLSAFDPDEDDEYYRESAAAWGRIQALFDAHLTDSETLIVGPAAADGTMAEDHGLYLRMVVGRTADGDLAGFLVGVVWT